MQETVTVPFGILGNEEIVLEELEDYQRGKNQEKISVKKTVFVC